MSYCCREIPGFRLGVRPLGENRSLGVETEHACIVVRRRVSQPPHPVEEEVLRSAQSLVPVLVVLDVHHRVASVQDIGQHKPVRGGVLVRTGSNGEGEGNDGAGVVDPQHQHQAVNPIFFDVLKYAPGGVVLE